MHERALRAVAAQFLINGAVYASFVPRLPEIREAVDVGLATLGLTLTVASFGGLAGSALVGRAVERFGTKRVLIASTIGVLASLASVGFVGSVLGLALALATLQFSDVFTDVAMNLQGSWLSARRSVPVMNRLHGLWSVGMLAGGVAATWAAGVGVSLQAHLVGTSLLLLLVAIYVGRNVLSADVLNEGPGNVPGSPRGRRGRPSSFGLALVVLGVAALVVEIVPTEWATFRMAEDFGFEVGSAGLGFITFITGMVVGRLGGDFAMARFGRRRLTRLGTLQAALGIGAATLIPFPPVALAAFFVGGVGVAVLFPTLYDDAAQSPGRPGAALGALTAGIRLGAIGAPIAVGYLADFERLSVGGAMALVALPCAVVILVVTDRLPKAVSAST